MTPWLSSFLWFPNAVEYHRYLEPWRPWRRTEEKRLAQQEYAAGYCTYCRCNTRFRVSAGLYFANEINLREGLLCERCGLSNRQRLLYTALEDAVGGLAELKQKQIFIPERLTPFFGKLAERIDNLSGSEYLRPGGVSGDVSVINGIAVVQQDLCGLSHARESFDVVLHADVLEHVADFKRALAEIFRILRRGGIHLFTVPFLHDRHDHVVRARVGEEGTIVHLLPPEIHGNPIDASGSLVFQTYGWEVLEDLRAAGFIDRAVGVRPAPSLGFTSSNSPAEDYMEPVVIASRKES